MKKYPLILFLFVLQAISCDNDNISDIQADSFIKYYINYSEFTAADVKQVSGSGYAILGTSKTSKDGTEICLIRTDEYGNTISSARFYGRVIDDIAYDDKAYALQVMDDGGFAILGSTKNPITEKTDVYFIRTNSVGDTLWTRVITHSGNVEANHFEINNQGSFIMTGYAEKSSMDHIKQIWIGALNQDGSKPYWSPKITLSENDAEGRHLQILDDGSFVITGVSKNDVTSPLYSHAFILKTNSLGGTTALYYLPSSADEEGDCIRVIDNDHFLVSGTITGSIGSDISLKSVSLSDRIVNWEKTYDILGNDVGRSMIKDGSSIYLLSTGGTSASFTSISLITTDAVGNETARSDFGVGSQLSASSFDKTSDGGFIISGSNKYSDNSISVALIKTGADTKL